MTNQTNKCCDTCEKIHDGQENGMEFPPCHCHTTTPDSVNGWENEFRKIGDGSVRFMATRQEVIDFIRNLLTQKESEVYGLLEELRIRYDNERNWDKCDVIDDLKQKLTNKEK